MAHHTLMDGKLHVYKRERSQYWQCSTFIADRNWRQSTREESLERAKDFAEDWYLTLKGKHKAGVLRVGRTFREAATQFEREYGVMTQGQRNAEYVRGHSRRLSLYLLPFFGDKVLGEITAGLVVEYRIWRQQHSVKSVKNPEGNRPPARGTIHQEIVVLRQVLKTAQRHGWLVAIPDLSPPYKTSGKVTHRGWFSLEEYRQLYTATRARAKDLKGNRRQAALPLDPNPRWKWECEQLHDMVLFLANTGLRPDEAKRLEYRDVSVIYDDASDETILLIEVRGKRGVGYCKSTSQAVRPFERLKARNRPKLTDRVFPTDQSGLFNAVLNELDLKIDREGNRRTLYSLRHSYICFRLMEGADVYQIAKNCRTSVDMIERHYAAHIKTNLNAAAINVRRHKPKPRDDKKRSQQHKAAAATGKGRRQRRISLAESE